MTSYSSLGRPGVDSHMRHEFEGAVLQIQFLTNEGALVTATADDSDHVHPPSSAEQVVVRGYRSRQHSRRQYRDLPTLRLRYQLEQSHR
ncbi:hypothetical protein B566_EDAN009283, partial [Ephemera danica]